MRKILYFFLIITSTLLSNQASTPQELASLQGESSALICDCVNAITGDLIFDQYDAIVKGAQPIPFRRRYISREIENPKLAWNPLYHHFAYSFSEGIDPLIYIVIHCTEVEGLTLIYEKGDYLQIITKISLFI